MLNANFTEIGISVQNGTLQGEQTTLVVEFLGQTDSAVANSGSSSSPNKTKPLWLIRPLCRKTLSQRKRNQIQQQRRLT